jgi:uncharacterized protein
MSGRRVATRWALSAVGLCLAVVWATAGTASSTWAEDEEPTRNNLPYLVDPTGVLNDVQAAALEQRLAQVSQERQADVVVVAVASLGGHYITNFADDYFDYGPSPTDPSLPGNDVSAGYGFGPTRSGILLLVALEERDAHFTTTGDAIEVFTDSRQDKMWDEITPMLSAGNWNGAFEEFASQADKAFYQASRFRWEVVVIAAAAAGLIGGFVPVTVWRRRLKSVKPAANARSYLQGATLTLNVATEQFVGQSTRVIDLSSSSGGGGSSTHIGSSGISHGGSSRHF